MYIPKVNYIYPENFDSQIIKINNNIKINEKCYKKLKKISFKIIQFIFRIFFVIFAYPAVKHRYHLKVTGYKEIKPYLKKYKKTGFITVSNHVFLWDYLSLCASLKVGFPNVPAWGKLISSKFYKIFALAGIIPIPEDQQNFKNFYKFIDDIFKKNEWIHIYPETGLWYYYAPIRPFKRGAAYFAYMYNKPIIPIGYSYRKRSGISKIFNKKDPFITVNIGLPIYPNFSLEKRKSISTLTDDIRKEIIKLVGISSIEENEKLIKEKYTYENGHYYTKL